MALTSVLARPLRSSPFLGPPLRSRVAPPHSTVPVAPMGRPMAPVAQFKDSDKPAPEKVKDQASRLGERLGGSIRDTARESPLDNSGTLGFTKKNELFVGRMAMLGFAASVIGEILTGRGILGQLNLETGIPVNTAPPLLLVFILFMIFGAFTSGMGAKGYSEADPLQPAKSKTIRGLFGLPDRGPLFGFTRPNEYLNGRVAMLGFAAALLGEIATGKGPIGQLSIETGIPAAVFQGILLSLPLLILAASNMDDRRRS